MEIENERKNLFPLEYKLHMYHLVWQFIYEFLRKSIK